MDRGHIYKSHYEGWYCVADESFVTESQITEKNDANKTKISVESGHPVEWTSEENYMFKLNALLPDVLHWIKTGELMQFSKLNFNRIPVKKRVHFLFTERPIFPEKFEGVALRWIEEDFHDLSVSRPSSRLSWGIPVPGDDSQVIYVWLDALVNYLTVSGYPSGSNLWPPTLQVVGKDILK